MEPNHLILLCILLFAISGIATKYCTDAYCLLATKIGLVDKPDVSRKLHKKSTPVGGGIVLFIVTFSLMGVLAFFLLNRSSSPLLAVNTLWPLLIAAVILVGVGLIDDKRGMSGKVKLLFQIIASSIVIFYAGAYSEVTAFQWTWNLGHLFYPIGIFWLVGMINSVNLLDGADGVATTTGFLMSLTAGIIALINGYMVVFFVAVIFSGSLFGFFCCNRPPAKVYLGDTGSMLIGLVVAVLLLRSCSTKDFTIHAVPPLAVALIPALDSIFAIIRRKNSKRTIFSPDRGHIHHRLQMKIGKGYKLLGILSLLILPGCLAAIAGVFWKNDWIPLTVSLGVVGVAVATGLFGREELKMLSHRIANRVRKRLRHKHYEKSGEVFHFQGDGPWKSLWEDLIPTLKALGCTKSHLDINMPFFHEDYSSDWENMELKGHTDILIQCSMPLVHEYQKVGTLDVTFDASTSDQLAIFHQSHELKEICAKYIDDFIWQKNAVEILSDVSEGIDGSK